MKTIKATKPSKHANVGDLKRVQDEEAEDRVKSGYWKYTNKTEWKKTKTEATTNDHQ